MKPEMSSFKFNFLSKKIIEKKQYGAIMELAQRNPKDIR